MIASGSYFVIKKVIFIILKHILFTFSTDYPGNKLKIPADIGRKEEQGFFLVQERVEGGTICSHMNTKLNNVIIV